MIKILSNFQLSNNEPLDYRDVVLTREELKNSISALIDEGHICFCKEDKTYYTYSDDNNVDSVTGKWIKLSSKMISELNDTFAQDSELLEAIQNIQNLQVNAPLPDLIQFVVNGQVVNNIQGKPVKIKDFEEFVVLTHKKVDSIVFKQGNLPTNLSVFSVTKVVSDNPAYDYYVFKPSSKYNSISFTYNNGNYNTNIEFDIQNTLKIIGNKVEFEPFIYSTVDGRRRSSLKVKKAGYVEALNSRIEINLLPLESTRYNEGFYLRIPIELSTQIYSLNGNDLETVLEGLLKTIKVYDNANLNITQQFSLSFEDIDGNTFLKMCGDFPFIYKLADEHFSIYLEAPEGTWR